jgi:hypothetical protein
MSQHRSAVAAASAVFALLATLHASAEVIEIPYGHYSFPYYGAPSINALGQTFRVGEEHYLNSFSVYFNAYGILGSPRDFRAYLARWDGGKASEILYVSDTRAVAGNGWNQLPTSWPEQRFVFNTGSLNLVTGAQYVAFVSNAGLDTSYGEYSLRGTLDAYPDGDFVYVHLPDGAGYEAVTTQPWSCYRREPVPAGGCNRLDMQFEAVLSASPVPEPSLWHMLGAGLAGMVAASLMSTSRSGLLSNV